MADRSKEFDVEFPPFDSDQGAAIASSLSAKVAVSNPLDYHTYDWGNRTALTATFTAMLDGPFDAGLLVLDVPSVPDTDATSWRASAEAITDARIATQTPAIAVATLSENMNDAFRSYLHASGVPVVHGIDEAFRAVEIASLLGRRRAAPPSVHSPPLTYGSVTTYGESQSKQILTEAGIANAPRPTDKPRKGCGCGDRGRVPRGGEGDGTCAQNRERRSRSRSRRWGSRRRGGCRPTGSRRCGG